MVGRTKELAELRAAFDAAAGGRGLLLCVSGEPGAGKTTLVEEFLAGLADSGRSCYAARGRCSERLSFAEPYLPIRDVVDALIREPADGSTAQVMKLVAPTWYINQVEPSAGDASGADLRAASRERMKREFSDLLRELSRRRPVVLAFDDVHWADTSSVDLLAHLAAGLESMPVLIVATYHPAELLRSKHPFLDLKLDLQDRGVCGEILLGRLSREDVDGYLALEFPGHSFPAAFADLLHARTDGSALFLADLLRYLRDRGVIALEAGAPEGHWVLGQAVPDIERDLPDSVRGMIRRRIDQLSEDDPWLLAAASVQGCDFEAAVVARALALDATEVSRRLDALESSHGFVRIEGEKELPDRTPTRRYRFAHTLYQNAFYASLGPNRRTSLSGAVAQALESCYGEGKAGRPANLALLFEAAQDLPRAVDYFLLASQNAAALFADRETETLARQGIQLLDTLPGLPDRAQKEMLLRLLLGHSLAVTQGPAALETVKNIARARQLAEQMREAPQLFSSVWSLWEHYFGVGELDTARQLAEQLRHLAEKAQDPILRLGACHAQGWTLFDVGKLVAANDLFERGIAIHEPVRHSGCRSLYGLDPGLYCRSGSVDALWLLGYPDRALRRLLETLNLAQTSDPRSKAFVLLAAAELLHFRREAGRSRQWAEAAVLYCEDQGLSPHREWAAVWLGAALAGQGAVEDGVARMRAALDALRSLRTETSFSFYLALMAEAQAKGGQVEAALATLEEAFSRAQQTGQHRFEAEQRRLKGEFLLRQAARAEAEACFLEALDVARRQRARSLELRAATSIGRLFEQQGEKEKARQILTPVCDWFTEGFDTPDLKDAKALLKQLS